MSDKFKKFLKNQQKEINDLAGNNNLNSENNEINYEYTTEENKNMINQDNNEMTNENEITTENRINDYNDSKNVEENENENNSNNEPSSENEEENQEIEDELPLITLNFISICQCCKNRFDKGTHLPYLLKCGHFFCLDCINQYFTEQMGIVCPSDGHVAKSVKELKLLKNLIMNPKSNKQKNKINSNTKSNDIDNNYENSDYYTYMKKNLENFNSENKNTKKNYCRIHKNQKLSHIICDTNEIICVHCAFEMLKLNPSMQIKEIKEKYNDLSDFIDNIMNSSQKNIDLIQNTIELIKKNKENERKKVKIFYNNLIKYLEGEKKSKIQKIENISKDNIHNLEQKLLIFNEIIEQGDEFQNNLNKKDCDINQNYSSVINNYNNILKLNQSNHSDNANNKLKYIKFINKNEVNIKEYLNKITNINIINRIMKYNKKIKSKEDNYNNNYSRATNDASSMKYKKIIVKKHFNNKNISSGNLNMMGRRTQNDSSEYQNFNRSVKAKNIDFFNNNFYKTNKSLKIGNMSNITSPQCEQKFIKIKPKIGNNKSLLQNYFDMKNREKNNDNSNEENNIYSQDNAESVKTQKNSKSFNNLNILNNFYNLDYNRRSPNNFDIRRKKYINSEQVRLYNASLNKLIPKQLKQFNFEY